MSGRDLRGTFPRQTRIDELGALAYDADTRGFGIIEPAHHMIHKGRHMEYMQYIGANLLDISKGCRIAFWITGDAKTAHVVPLGNWSQAARLEIWEGVTITNTGVAVTAYNSKRVSSFAHSGIVYSGVSFYDPTASGTLVRTYYQGTAGGGPTSKGGGTSREGELMVLGNTDYLYWLRPDGDNAEGLIGVDWYEEL